MVNMCLPGCLVECSGWRFCWKGMNLSRNLDIKSDRRPLDIGLVSPLPPLNSEAIVLRDFNSNLVENGGIVNLPTLNVRVLRICCSDQMQAFGIL